MSYAKMFILVVVYLFSGRNSVWGQTLTIKSVQVKKEARHVVAKLDPGRKVNIGKYRIKGFEKVRDIEKEVKINTLKGSEPTVILYLLDESGSMVGEKIEQATNAIYEIVQNHSANSNLLFAGFHNDVKENQRLDESNIADIISTAKREVSRELDTDLNYAIISKIRQLEEEYQGYNKVIILITDGYNDIRRNPHYSEKEKRPIKYTKSDVYKKVGVLDANFHICVVGVGDAAGSSLRNQIRGLDKEFAEALPQKSPSTEDKFRHAQNVDDIKAMIKEVSSSFLNEFEITYEPWEPRYIGQNRQLRLEYSYGDVLTGEGVKTTYSAGSSGNGFSIEKETAYGFLFIVGLALSLGLLLLFVVCGPILEITLFRRKYVKIYAAYKKEHGKEKHKHYDPRSGVELEKL